MKDTIKEKHRKEGTVNDNSKVPNPNDSDEIKTDFPLSEKDEVKAAEERMRSTAKKRRIL